jgi:hypothetical protein
MSVMAKQPTKPIDRPAVPRHKSKKSKAAAADNPHIIDADASRLSDNIPDEIKIAIANSIIAYSAMENAAERLIWDVAGLSYDDGKLLTRNGANKFDILKQLLEQHGVVVHYSRRTTISMWDAIRQVVPTRNLIVHGVWAMLDNAMPVSISYKLSSDTGHVLGEPFDLERLQAVGRQCIKVKNVLEGLSKRRQRLKGLIRWHDKP